MMDHEIYQANPPTFFEREGEPSEHSPTVWAMTDLVFLLLIVFILGLRSTPVAEIPFAASESRQKGPMTPYYGKQVFLEIVLESTPSGAERFRYSLESYPTLDDEAFSLPSPSAPLATRDDLFIVLATLERNLGAFQEKYPDYRVRRTFVAPASMEYGRILSLIGRLQEETGRTWLGAATEEKRDG